MNSLIYILEFIDSVLGNKQFLLIATIASFFLKALILCFLYLRSNNRTAKTPEQMLKLPLHEIEKIIYSVGFYKNKAKQLKSVSQQLIERFDGTVPDSYEELISIKSVGPKTANLVLSEAFRKPAIIVDVHVHRVSNRLGLIKTTTVEQTQQELEKILPQEYWREYSQLILIWGQNICGPISPFCSKCPLFDICKRVGVTRSR